MQNVMPEFVAIVQRTCAWLQPAAASAFAGAILRSAGKLASRLLTGGAKGDEARAFEAAMLGAVAHLMDEFPDLRDINFFSILEHDALAAELTKAFNPDLTPDAAGLRVALDDSGFVFETLPNPCTAEDVFSRLYYFFREEIKRNSILQPLFTSTNVERVLAGQADTNAKLEDLQSKMAAFSADLSASRSVLSSALGTPDGVLDELNEEYRAGIERSREQLKKNRYVDARDLLAGLQVRGTFRFVDAATQAEVYRLYAIACMHIGQYSSAEHSFAQATERDPEHRKLRLNVIEFQLRIGKRDEAEAAAQAMLLENEDDSDAHRLLVLAALDKHDTGAARQHLAKAGLGDDPSGLSMRAACDLAEGLFEEALPKVEAALGAEPDDPVLLLQKATILNQMALSSPGLQSGISIVGLSAQRREMERARDAFRAAVRSWDEHGLRAYSSYPRVQLAVSLSLLDEQQEALSAAVEATECLDANHEAWVVRARCELDVQDTAAAEESLARAAALAPDDAGVVLVRAGLKGETGRPLDAVEDISHSFSDRWHPREKLEARALQVRFLWQAGEQEKAFALLDSLPPEMGQTPRLIAQKSGFLITARRYQEAQALLDAGIQDYPNEPALLHICGDAYLATNDSRRALSRYAKALRLAPNPDSLYGAAQCCVLLGRPKAVLRLTEAFARRGISDNRLYEMTARAWFDLGDLQEAADVYERYLQAIPDDTVALNNASVCHWRLGRRDKALPLIERIAQLRQTDWEVCVRIAQIHLADGANEKAFEWARQALSRGQEHPEAYLFYIMTGFNSGHSDEVGPALQELHQKFPDFQGLRIMQKEEGIEVFKQSLARTAEVERLYQEGKLPITFVVDQLNQALPLYRAIRQWNSQTFRAETGHISDLKQRYTACASSPEVVIDYPALVTLAQHDFLTPAMHVFRKIHVLFSIREQLQHDRMKLNGRLGYFKDRGQRAIRDRLMDSGTLESWRAYSDDLAKWPASGGLHDKHLAGLSGAHYLIDWRMLEAQSPDELPPNVITSKSLLSRFWSLGLDRERYERAVEYLQKTGNWESDGTAPLTETPEKIVIEAWTASTWHAMGLLDYLLGTVRLLVSPWTVHRLNSDVAEEEVYAEALRLVDLIEATMQEQGGVFTVTQPSGNGTDSGERPWEMVSALAAKISLPLWSDDLVTQLFHSHQVSGAKCFSTRTVAEVAFKRRHIGADQYHKTVLSLVHGGYVYCSFNAQTLAWTLRQHNYQLNDDTLLLLSKQGDVMPFRIVITNTIAELARTHDASGEPNSRQLRECMQFLAMATDAARVGLPRAVAVRTKRALSGRSYLVRRSWDTLVEAWDSLGLVRNPLAPW